MSYEVKSLPTTVRVGPHDIRFGELEGEGARKSYGMWEPSDHTIRLLDEYSSGSMAVETVIHEVLHAIFAVGSVDPKRGEEHIVSTVGTYLAQIIRDNPRLIAWLQATIKK